MNILLFIWQLPQHIAALFIILFHKIKKAYLEKMTVDGITIYRGKHIADCGVSLGNYIFIDSDRILATRTVHHEHGHQLQSKYLGPLYLIVIGIPSACGNIRSRIYYKKHNKTWDGYYKQPWEAWADRLGGVQR